MTIVRLKKLIIEHMLSGVEGTDQALSEKTGVALFHVQLAMKQLIEEDLAINYNSRDGQAIILKSWAKEALDAGHYDDDQPILSTPIGLK